MHIDVYFDTNARVSLKEVKERIKDRMNLEELRKQEKNLELLIRTKSPNSVPVTQLTRIREF